jgi:hypothetical protein
MAWTDSDLDRIGDTQELELASLRPSGSLGRYTTMWVVRVGGDLYVRSAGGPERPWFQRALTSRIGRVRAGAVERDVTFGDASPTTHAEIDTAYHAKYDSYGPRIVNHVTGPNARAVTIRLMPRSEACTDHPIER